MTDEFDDQLRRRWEAESGTAPPADDLWERTQGRIRQRAIRNRLGSVAALAVLLVGAVAVVLASTGDSESDVVASPETTAPPPESPPDSTVVEPPPEAATTLDAGYEFVGVTVDGELRRYAADGSDLGLVAELDTPPDLMRAGGDVVVSPDGALAFVSVMNLDRVDDCEPAVAHAGWVNVPLAGGEPVTLTDGAEGLAISPDGQRVAYHTNTDGSPCGAPELVEVVDLDTGDTERTDEIPTDFTDLLRNPGPAGDSGTTTGLFWTPPGVSAGVAAADAPLDPMGFLSEGGDVLIPLDEFDVATSLSTLPGPNPPGILIVAGNENSDFVYDGRAYLFSVNGKRVELARGLYSADWIPRPVDGSTAAGSR